jgi:DNA-binding response OmpR family regulator
MGRRFRRWHLEQEALEPAARPRRVVVADDDELFRHLVCWALRAEGYEVLEARDGNELADLLGSTVLRQGAEPIDLILTDVRMPGWSGIQVVASLRNMDWAIPVIVVTGHKVAESEQEARRLGATLFHKPCELGDLLEAVHAAIPPLGDGPGPRGSRTAAATV